MKRRSSRGRALAAKKQRKAIQMSAPGSKSKYALKRMEQARGKFRPTSPFRGWAIVDVPTKRVA